MPATILDRPLLLTGMPGVGKTTIGRLLSEKLELRFIDTDEEVEREHGRGVDALWAAHGEAGFRALERHVLCAVLALREPRVVAVGGGALLDDNVRRQALSATTIVWLQAPLPVLAARLRDRPRPVLGDGNPLSVLEQLEAGRSGRYAQAPIHVPYRAVPPEATVAAILAALQR